MHDGREDGSRMSGVPVLATVLIALMLVVQMSVPMRVMSQGEETQPMGWVGDDFIISFPDKQNATNPTIAMTPTNEFTKKEGYAGSVHAVWDEIYEETGIREIHYSMSADGGYKWTGEEADFIISSTKKAEIGDAVQPSIAVDSWGRIHVVWAEQRPDMNWELFYTRSDDNGRNWFPDKQITSMSPNFNSRIVSAPKIVAGVVPGQMEPTNDILHVVWGAYNLELTEEVFYIRSIDFGDTWDWRSTGQFPEGNMISKISATEDGRASDPVISTSGLEAQFVHVSWIQKGVGSEFDRVFYLRSDNYGITWVPNNETLISDPQENMVASAITLTSFFDEVHVVWSESFVEGAGKGGLVYYMGCPDNGNTWDKGEAMRFPINNNDDGNAPSTPSIVLNNKSHAYAYWCERHEKSGTIEIHTSFSEYPMEGKWTGQEQDIIISNPSEYDVSNVSVTIGELPDGEWRPQVIWEKPIPEEKMLGSGGGDSIRAKPTNEIHYNPPGGPPPPPEWTLSTSVDGSGTITRNPNKSTYSDGETVELTANPSTGWSFSQWSGNLSGSTNPQSLYMDGNKSVTAHFTQDQYTLTVNIYGDGSVSKNPDQITYNHADTVTLTANPDFGWSFDQWSGHLTGSTNPTSIVMDSDKTVTAKFTQNIYNISLNVGWNLVSLPFIQGNTSVANVLSSINGSYAVVKYYDTLDTSPWKTYRVGSSVNSLTDLDHTMAFWLYATSSCTLSVYGDMPASTNISLYAGWNLVGYPSSTSRLASNTLPSIADIISVFQATSPYVSDITDLSSVTMSQGNGYWVHVTSDTVWTVDL